MEKKLNSIRVKPQHNYVAFFLTLACNLRCPYCINLSGTDSKYRRVRKSRLTPEEWIDAANRLILRKDLSLTLQGGEPTLYKGFYKIVNEVKKNIKMDLLTNMIFDVDEFIDSVPVWRFIREAPYAPIRVSYHPGQNDIDDLITKTVKMQKAGFRVGVYGILHPEDKIRKYILKARDKCLKVGLDFRTKEFLGEWKGRFYGTYKYDGAIDGDGMKMCECKTTELIVGPDGNIYRCHSDLYRGRPPVAHVLDEDFTEEEMDNFRTCGFYGDCNPCDVKVKTDRFQNFGHTSVEIINIQDVRKTDDCGGI